MSWCLHHHHQLCTHVWVMLRHHWRWWLMISSCLWTGSDTCDWFDTQENAAVITERRPLTPSEEMHVGSSKFCCIWCSAALIWFIVKTLQHTVRDRTITSQTCFCWCLYSPANCFLKSVIECNKAHLLRCCSSWRHFLQIFYIWLHYIYLMG